MVDLIFKRKIPELDENNTKTNININMVKINYSTAVTYM